jgi:hypothetical protein
MPLPLQSVAAVSVLDVGPSTHVAGTHTRPDAYSAHDVPAAVQEPLVPQVATPWSEQATPQQMPPSQKPLVHCAPAVQRPPLASLETQVLLLLQ